MANDPNIPVGAAPPMKEVEGKVAFITGGDSGIGLGIARVFVAAGMKVVITYRTRSHLDQAMRDLQHAASSVHAIHLDVTDRAGMERAAVETLQVFKKVHVVVNNAGVGLMGPLSTATYDDWDWAMGVNATGVFNGIRTFLPRIQAHGEGGQIVSTASVAGLLGHSPLGVYTASKFAVVGMMEALRAELDGTNIGVSVFCPGFVNTNIADSNRNRPTAFKETGFQPPAHAPVSVPAEHSGPPPGMDILEAGQLVLRGVRNNDLYILTSPELESEFQARGDAVVASLPKDVHAPAERLAISRMLLGKTVYARELDRLRLR